MQALNTLVPPGYNITDAAGINDAGQIAATGTTPSDPVHPHALLLDPAQLNRFAYAWANQPTAESYTPAADYAYSASGGFISIHRTSAGRYQVFFSNLRGGVPGLSSTAVVTAYGSSTASCSLSTYTSSPDGGFAAVSCVDAASGLAADSQFTILVVGNRSLPALTAFALTGGVAPIPPLDPETSFTTGRLPITVTHNATAGEYSVLLGTGNTPASAKLVSAAAGGGARCNNVEGISGGLRVRCYDASGAPSDQPFSIVQVPGGRSGRRIGFAFANASSAPAYTPTTTTAFNSSGGAITATRSAVGHYAMTFAGLQKLAGHTEDVQVTGMGGALRTCNVVSWGNAAGGLQVNVECRDAAGKLADARYDVLVIE